MAPFEANKSSSSFEDIAEVPQAAAENADVGTRTKEETAPSTDTQQIADHMLGDQPAKKKDEDRLGFGAYVAAVAKFLMDSSTKLPLTLSIEGLWGSGKSSFMLLLQEALKNNGKVVAFNAWQYNADDGLWAAFIHEFDEELHKQLRWPERIRARLMLFRLRMQWRGLIDTLISFLWLGASVVAFIAIAKYLYYGGETSS